AAKRVKDVRSTSAKLRMSRANAGVDHVCTDAGAGPVVGIGRTQRTVTLIDAIKAPRWIALRYIRSDYAVFFNKQDSEVLAQTFSIFWRHLDRKAIESVLVDVFEFAAVRSRQFSGDVRRDREETLLTYDRVI